MNQQIRFCKSFDGTRLAYAMTGEGPPLDAGGELPCGPRLAVPVKLSRPKLCSSLEAIFRYRPA